MTARPATLAGLVLDAMDDMARVVEGLSAADAVDASDGSSHAWTFAHVANQLDAWINVRFQGRAPQALVAADAFRNGGDGAADDWDAIRRAVADVWAAATPYLMQLSDDDLDRRVDYDGSFAALRDRGLPLRHALARVAAHHYVHVGEIATKRARNGEAVGDYPGALGRTVS